MNRHEKARSYIGARASPHGAQPFYAAENLTLSAPEKGRYQLLHALEKQTLFGKGKQGLGENVGAPGGCIHGVDEMAQLSSAYALEAMQAEEQAGDKIIAARCETETAAFQHLHTTDDMAAMELLNASTDVLHEGPVKSRAEMFPSACIKKKCKTLWMGDFDQKFFENMEVCVKCSKIHTLKI